MTGQARAGVPPEVSVVIPAFNAADTLGAQLAALMGQRTDRTFEVIVADNGSTDATAAVAAEVGRRDPRVRVVDASQVRGASAARNAGATAARGHALLFCDADDVASPTWIEELAGVLDSHQIAAGTLEVARLNVDNRASVTWHASGFVRFGFWPEFAAAPTSSVGVLRDAFESAGGFDTAMAAGEDVDLCWRIQLQGGTLGYSEGAVMHVRRRDGLRLVALQAFVWGSGERLLAFKYRELASSAAAEVGPPLPAPPNAIPLGGHRLRRLLAVRRIGDLADPVWRAANAAGRRWGRIPANLEPLSASARRS